MSRGDGYEFAANLLALGLPCHELAIGLGEDEDFHGAVVAGFGRDIIGDGRVFRIAETLFDFALYEGDQFGFIDGGEGERNEFEIGSREDEDDLRDLDLLFLEVGMELGQRIEVHVPFEVTGGEDGGFVFSPGGDGPANLGAIPFDGEHWLFQLSRRSVVSGVSESFSPGLDQLWELDGFHGIGSKVTARIRWDRCWLW